MLLLEEIPFMFFDYKFYESFRLAAANPGFEGEAARRVVRSDCVNKDCDDECKKTWGPDAFGVCGSREPGKKCACGSN